MLSKILKAYKRGAELRKQENFRFLYGEELAAIARLDEIMSNKKIGPTIDGKTFEEIKITEYQMSKHRVI